MYKGVDTMENEETGLKTDDSTEVLLEEYDRKQRNKPDDVIAMQSVVCILIAVLMFGANFLYPQTVGELAARVRSLTQAADICPNPVDLIIEYIERT